MNIHAVPIPKFCLFAYPSEEPDHGDEPNYHEFNTEAELKAFKDGLEYAYGQVLWFHGDKDLTYLYCENCRDSYTFPTESEFQDNHPWDDH